LRVSWTEGEDAALLNFRHDLLDSGALEPPMAITRIIPAPGTIHSQKARKAV
jgi:hypothetical protein